MSVSVLSISIKTLQRIVTALINFLPLFFSLYNGTNDSAILLTEIATTIAMISLLCVRQTR